MMNTEQKNLIADELLVVAAAGYHGPVTWADHGAFIVLPDFRLHVVLTPDNQTRVVVTRDGLISVFDSMDEALDTLTPRGTQ